MARGKYSARAVSQVRQERDSHLQQARHDLGAITHRAELAEKRCAVIPGLEQRIAELESLLAERDAPSAKLLADISETLRAERELNATGTDRIRRLMRRVFRIVPGELICGSQSEWDEWAQALGYPDAVKLLADVYDQRQTRPRGFRAALAAEMKQLNRPDELGDISHLLDACARHIFAAPEDVDETRADVLARAALLVAPDAAGSFTAEEAVQRLHDWDAQRRKTKDAAG